MADYFEPEENGDLEATENVDLDDMMAEFLEAAEYGDLDEVIRLLDEGVDKDARDKDGNTALMLAAYNHHTEIVEQLLEAGAKLDIQNWAGFTAVMLSINVDSILNLEIMKLLIEAGANLNIQSKDGSTVLILVASIGSTEAVKLLIEAGAKLDLKDAYGNTALIAAAENNYPEIVELLLPKMNLENLEASAIRARNAEFTPEINEFILNYTKNIMDRRRFNKLIGATPVPLKEGADPKYGPFNKIEPGLMSNLIGPFVGPKNGGRRRHRKTKKRSNHKIKKRSNRKTKKRVGRRHRKTKKRASRKHKRTHKRRA